ncbi:MAG TPA: phosphate ABC transporter substrate-binding protein [Armatimonadota bacterium]|nr:phosphate ABC transporter substrate-binding protein [Armatimonadota bacterium]
MMQTKLFAIGLLALGALGLMLAGGGSASAVTKPIQVKGSDTMVNLCQAWAEAFMAKTKIPVSVTGGGSGTGIAALINGKTDICTASRPMKAEEIRAARQNGITPKETIVAWDGISVVINPNNKASKLTMEQLAKIYIGEITNWKEVGGADGKILLLGREVNSGTHVFFKEHVIQGYKKTADYAKSMLMLPSNQAIHDEVAKNVNAVGYIGLGYVTPKVAALAVAAEAGKPYVLPSVKSVKDKTYPVARPLYWYTHGAPKGNLKKLVDFALSAAGQKIVAELDFVPVK